MVRALRKAGMLSCCSRCSSMSSGTERENSVSSSCILEPEGPVACRRREERQSALTAGGVRDRKAVLPAATSAAGLEGHWPAEEKFKVILRGS